MGKSYRLDVRGDVKRLQKDITELSERQIVASARSSSNRVLKKLSRRWLKLVASKLNIKQAALKKHVIFVKATAKFPSAVVFFKTYGLNFFKAGKLSGKRLTEALDTYEPDAFVATMPSGHKGIFKRKFAKRLPIKEIKIDIKNAVLSTKRRIETLAVLMFKKEFEKDISKKIAKKFG